ncbi:MAG TPA: hypothetical protein VKU61_15055 [Candidatus Binatia bacterium]|nr:hypothetical protein [Candidatus Binatia bacterium]
MRISGAPLLVLAASLGFLLCQPLAIGRADESHLLHGARRVLDGEVLYRDVFEWIAPLGFYFFAAVYRVFGTTLAAARIAMAFINAIGAAAMFLLTRDIAGAGAATLATMLFVGVCLPAWPVASAHWMSTTLALITATVVLRPPAVSAGRWRPLAAGSLTGLAVCVQQQRGVFLALWLGIVIPLVALAAPRTGWWRRVTRDLAYAAGGAVGVVVVILGAAASAASPAALISALYRFPVETYAETMAANVSWAEAIPLATGTLPYTWHWLLRVAPIFPVLETAVLVGRIRRGLTGAELARASVCLLGGLMALSIWYLRDFIHVAFVTPVLLIPGASLLAVLQASIQRRGPSTHRIVVAALVGACAIVAVKGVVDVRRAYAAAPVQLDSGFGRLRVGADLAPLYAAVRRHLVREPDGRMLAYSFPDDAWLYLTLPAHDTARFDFMMPNFPARYVDEITGMLWARVPGMVVLLRPIPAGRIRDAVGAAYDLAEQVGPYDVYVRRGSVPPPAR